MNSSLSPASDAALPNSDQSLFSSWHRPALIMTVALILLRAVYLAFPNLFPEEAYYWNYAKHLDYGYLDHPPMVAWLIHLGTLIFGDTELGVRIFALLCSLAATYFVYRLTALLYDRSSAGFSALLMQALPFFFMTGFMMTPDAPLTACWAGAMYYLARVFFEGRAAAWLGVGVFLGLGMLSKYTTALLGPSILLFIVLDKDSRHWLRHAAPYSGALLALVIFSPVILWNANHHWASFAFQSTGRVQREPRRFSLHELLGAMLVVLTPLGAFFAGKGLVARKGNHPPAAASDENPSLSNTANDPAARRLLFARVFTLVPLAVFVFFSLQHRVKLNWTGPLWLAAIPMLAAQLSALAAAPDRAWLRRGWQITFGVCALAFLAFLQHMAFGIPGLRYSENIDLMPVAWSQLGHELEAQAADAQRAAPAGAPMRIVGMDRNFIASEAAFYHSQPAKAAFEIPGAHLFGVPSLMYGYWYPPEEQNSANLLLVSFKHSALDRAYVAEHSRPQGKIQKHQLYYRGRKICAYYTRVVYDYRSVSNAPKK